METCATEGNGEYGKNEEGKGCTQRKTERNRAGDSVHWWWLHDQTGRKNYTITAAGTSGTFTIKKTATALEFTCTGVGKGGCPASGVWSS